MSIIWSNACWQIPWLIEKQLRLTLGAGAFRTSRGSAPCGLLCEADNFGVAVLSYIKERCPLFVIAVLQTASLNTTLDLLPDKCNEFTASPLSRHMNGLDWTVFLVASKLKKFQLFLKLKNHICGHSWQNTFFFFLTNTTLQLVPWEFALLSICWQYLWVSTEKRTGLLPVVCYCLEFCY